MGGLTGIWENEAAAASARRLRPLGAEPTEPESGSHAALLELRGGVVISRIGHVRESLTSASFHCQETDESEAVYRSAAFRRANLRLLGISVLLCWNHLPNDDRRLSGS